MSRIISGLLLASLPLFKNVYLFAVVYSLYNAFVGIGGAARSSYISGIALEGSEATMPAVTNIAIRASSTPAIALSGYLIEANPLISMPIAGSMFVIAGLIMLGTLKELED